MTLSSPPLPSPPLPPPPPLFPGGSFYRNHNQIKRKMADTQRVKSIPQTRRKYLSRLLAPEDSDAEREIRGDMFVLRFPGADRTRDGGGGGVTPMAVRRGVVDVHEDGDGGWIKKADSRSGSKGRKSGSGSLTPERAKSSKPGSAGRRRVSGRG